MQEKRVVYNNNFNNGTIYEIKGHMYYCFFIATILKSVLIIYDDC